MTFNQTHQQRTKLAIAIKHANNKKAINILNNNDLIAACPVTADNEHIMHMASIKLSSDAAAEFFCQRSSSEDNHWR